ncbi:MAG: hypothetical protein FJX61_13175 [Alphaproteobacteria bacterium]|nr:hypothetical protein [Alphaproteobacteria bacterium]
MKLVIILAVVLLVLGLGGGAAFVLMFDFADKKEAKVEAAPKPVNLEELKLDPFIVPVTSSQHTAVKVELVLVDKAAAAKVKALTPKLRDALLTELYAQADKGGRAATVMDFTAVQPRLLAAARKVIGEADVVDIRVGDATLDMAKPPVPKTSEKEKKKSSH